MLITVDGQTYGPIPVTDILDVASYGVFIKWDINDFDPGPVLLGLLHQRWASAHEPTAEQADHRQLGYTPSGSADMIRWSPATS